MCSARLLQLKINFKDVAMRSLFRRNEDRPAGKNLKLFGERLNYSRPIVY